MTAERALARPESMPNQNGEAAPIAPISGSASRSPISAWTAASADGTETCTCRAHSGVRLISPRISPSTRR
jgi:hypothetical protein